MLNELTIERYRGLCGINATLTKELFYSEKFTREQWKRYEAINDNGYTRVLVGNFVFDERIIGIEIGVQYGYLVTLIEMEDLGM